jgi:hypothetical protein
MYVSEVNKAVSKHPCNCKTKSKKSSSILWWMFTYNETETISIKVSKSNPSEWLEQL